MINYLSHAQIKIQDCHREMDGQREQGQFSSQLIDGWLKDCCLSIKQSKNRKYGQLQASEDQLFNVQAAKVVKEDVNQILNS